MHLVSYSVRLYAAAADHVELYGQHINDTNGISLFSGAQR